MCVCAYFLWCLHLGSHSSLGLETPGFTFPLLPTLHFVRRSHVRKQASRGFNHFAIKAELLYALIQAKLLEEGLGSWAGLSSEHFAQGSHIRRQP